MASLVPAVMAIALLAQGTTAPKPDFSGKWTMDRERSESAVQDQPIEPVTLAITQADTTFTVETIRRDQSSSVATYPIQASPGAPGVLAVGVRRAYWDGLKLVTEGSGTVQGQTVSIRETRAINATGTEMTVETMVIVQHGYSLRGGRNYGIAKDVYLRAAR
ncbi:MAG: hypothetical protein ABI665_21645 [Vicinamibacterales bacterium]